MSHVLVVDDEPSICWGFRELLTGEGHEVSIAPSAEEALDLAEQKTPDAVVLDVRLPGLDGLSVIPRLRDWIGDTPIIVITAFGNLETAVQALEAGAFDYLTKPFDLDVAAEILERALNKVRSGASPVVPPVPAQEGVLVGSSPAMQTVFKQIALVAPTDVPVLITGESGTGKELVARAVHRHSPRKSGPFVPISVAAVSPNVIESELFGHVRGAFTGAERDRRGLLELAHSGTVLLDEIGDVPLHLQVKLLRAIEQREVTPVGDARPRNSDFRVIAATNRPLPGLIAAGEFREDLFYRLSVFHIELPPLRERKDDIPLLVEHFLEKTTGGAQAKQFTAEAIQELRSRPWFGNVRELRNAVEHAAIVARGERIDPEHLPKDTSTRSPVEGSLERRLQKSTSTWAAGQLPSTDGACDEIALYERYLQIVEPALLRTVLEHCGENRAAAARLLGIHRATLRQKLRRYGS